MRKRIIVIDDELAVREAFEIALAKTGYEVVAAASGVEGLARAREVTPDLIFLDLRMPDMDGVETLRRLRKDYPATPPYIYIVTAFSQAYLEPLSAAARAGLDFEVLDKPVTDEQIVELVRAVLEEPRAR